jgi:hypothetical protein
MTISRDEVGSLQYDIFEEPNIIKGQYGAIEELFGGT